MKQKYISSRKDVVRAFQTPLSLEISYCKVKDPVESGGTILPPEQQAQLQRLLDEPLPDGGLERSQSSSLVTQQPRDFLRETA